MALGINAAIVVTSLAATAIVGVASAPIVANDGGVVVADKRDRLPIVPRADGYVTLESRADGISVLERVPLD
jgi:hypothetical protein